MIRAWKRFRDDSGRRWRAEARATVTVARPKFRARTPHMNPTKILFINQYYWPSHASTAQHLTDLAESLAERGFECHVLCDRGGQAAEPARRPSHETHNGVHIHRVCATTFGRKCS